MVSLRETWPERTVPGEGREEGREGGREGGRGECCCCAF